MTVAVLDELATELATYEQRRNELLGSSLGKFVLIKGDQVAAAYDSERDAVAEGYRRYGNVPFLVKQVAAVDRPLNFFCGIGAI